jgi:hypothetical protein
MEEINNQTAKRSARRYIKAASNIINSLKDLEQNSFNENKTSYHDDDLDHSNLTIVVSEKDRQEGFQNENLEEKYLKGLKTIKTENELLIFRDKIMEDLEEQKKKAENFQIQKICEICKIYENKMNELINIKHTDVGEMKRHLQVLDKEKVKIEGLKNDNLMEYNRKKEEAFALLFKIEMDKEPLIAIKIENAKEKEKIENLLKDFENEKNSQAVILEEKSRESEERKINFVNEKNAEFLKKEEKRSIELKSLKDRLESEYEAKVIELENMEHDFEIKKRVFDESQSNALKGFNENKKDLKCTYDEHVNELEKKIENLEKHLSAEYQKKEQELLAPLEEKEAEFEFFKKSAFKNLNNEKKDFEIFFENESKQLNSLKRSLNEREVVYEESINNFEARKKIFYLICSVLPILTAVIFITVLLTTKRFA